MAALYPIRAVAKLTGISVETLRAWERRYHAVTPDRSGRGRLYSDWEVRRLQLLRTAVESGHSIGQVATLSDTELQELVRTPLASQSVRQAESVVDSSNPNLQPVVDAIAAFDSETVDRELSRLALLLSPIGLIHEVVLPLMQLAGEKWESGNFRIAQEHMFSACLRNLLGGLMRLHRPGNSAGRVLLTTPVGELHEFGILAAGMLAVSHDFQLTYLGPNLPATEILAAAKESAADVVVLGIMKINANLVVRREMAWLSSELPISTQLWAGGTGAAETFDGIVREQTFILSSLSDLEGQFARWKARRSGLIP